MHEEAFGFPPTSAGMARFTGFLKNQSDLYGKTDERVWGDLAHVFVNSKSFIYLK